MDSYNNQISPHAIKPLPLFVGAMLVFVLFGNWFFIDLREGVKRDAQRNVSAIGEIKANQIRVWLDSRMSDANTLSDNSFFSREATKWMQAGAPHDARRQQLVARLNAFLAGHHYRAIVLYDTAGRAVLNTGESILNNLKIGAEVKHVQDSGQFSVIDLHRHQGIANSIGMGFLTPLRDGMVYTGALYLAENPTQYLFPLLDDEPEGSETAETQLVRIEGDFVLFLNQHHHRDEPPLGFRLPLNSPRLASAIALRGKHGLLEHAQDERGQAVLAYATAIQGTPWMLVSKVDEQDAYHLLNKIRNITFFLGIFTFGLTGAWFWQWRRREQATLDSAILQERLRADVLLLESEKSFHMIFEHTALPMARHSINGEFIEVNDAWCDMYGYEREEVLSQHLTWQQITYPDDVELGLKQLSKMFARDIEHFKLDKRYIHKEGHVLWGAEQVSLVRDEKGEPEYIISAIQDISEHKQAEQQISFMAYHDKLTGLPNRALFFDRLSQTISQARRGHKHVALMYLDLDGFKPINDIHGHEAGDVVLKMAAQRLLACVRTMDTVARLGGDEFAVIVCQLDSPTEIERIAEQILQAFAQAMTLPSGSECTVGASIGISIYPDNGGEMDSLLAAADEAMYDSKRKGKSTYSYFGGAPIRANDGEAWILFDEMHHVGVLEIDEQHRELVRLVNRLNGAIKNKENDATTLRLYDELLEFTAFHFATEHRLMEQSGYPELILHDLEHTHLLEEAQRFKSRLTEGGDLLALQSIKDWLLNHIQFADKPMASYLLANKLE